MGITSTSTTREQAPRRLPVRWQERMLRLPILYKVLIANAAIVVIGAVVGTWLTLRVAHEVEDATRSELILFFAVCGVLLSVAVNYVVLRAAFQPVISLERVASEVRAGNLSARAKPTTFDDPQVARLAETFNATLDELARDRTQLRQLASQVIRAQEDERKRIARELHDDTAQILFAQLLRLTNMKASPSGDVRDKAGELEEMTVEAIEGVRRLALELRPPALDDLGLHEALGELAQRFSEQLGYGVEYTAHGVRGRLPAEIELVLYRVAQEAMTNVAKHADASRAEITIDRQPEWVRLTVKDDGCGFVPRSLSKTDGRGLGLFGMEERLALVGGTFEIESHPSSGTEVIGRIPLNATNLRGADTVARDGR